MGSDHDVGAHLATDSPGTTSGLNSDIIWLIFIMNTALNSDQNGHDRLTTARSCSQVCRRWRETILSSSILWARLIDLDHLYFNDDNGVNNWRNEVLSRAGSSLIWIQGNVNSRTHAFFCAFLDQNWDRIQRVDISEGDKSICYTTSLTTAWDGLTRRAPHLQAFNVCHTGSPMVLPRPGQGLFKITSLFKAGAPLLQEISVPGIKFNTTNCSWLANLRRIVLSYIFSIPDMFEIISQTPLLESLEILGKIGVVARGRQINPAFEIYADLPTPNLPRLNELNIRAHFTAALPFIEHISLADSCRLYLVLKDEFGWIGRRTANSDVRKVETDKLQVIRRRVMSHLPGHLATCNVTKVHIHLQQDRLVFSAYTDVGRSPSYSITGSFGRDSGPEVLEEILLSEWIPRVREMSVYILDCPSAAPKISHFPSALRSLRVLQTSEDMLDYILKSTSLASSPSGSFPSLETLRLTRMCASDSAQCLQFSSRVISKFFEWQHAGGSPISVLDLTDIPYYQLHDMDYLDAVVGLQTIRWKRPDSETLVHQCGTGQPERLQFAEKNPDHYIWQNGGGTSERPNNSE